MRVQRNSDIHIIKKNKINHHFFEKMPLTLVSLLQRR